MSELFRQDNEIKVSKSPFSKYENEKMIYDGRLTPISIEDIMFKVRRGHIVAIDFIILEAVSELKFSTSRMVTQYLNLKGIDIDQLHTHNRLKVMNKINLISRCKFQSDEGQSTMRVYCIEKAGKYLLISRNYECNWKPTDNTLPIDRVKEILSRNQLLLTYRKNLDNIISYNLNPQVKIMTIGKYLKPHLQIDLKVNNEIRHIFFEVIRSYEGYIENAVKRLKLYEEFYNNFTQTTELQTPPHLIIISENDPHIGKIYKNILFDNKIKFKGISYLFTTDLRIIDNLKTSILTDHIENGSNKVQLKIINYDGFNIK